MMTFDRIVNRIGRRLDGPQVRFQDPSTTAPVLAPLAEPGTPPGPAAATRPGAGAHANDCAYLDDPWHRCVAEDGQPSNLMCVATLYAGRRRAGQRTETTPCVICHQPTLDADQICGLCRQEVA